MKKAGLKRDSRKTVCGSKLKCAKENDTVIFGTKAPIILKNQWCIWLSCYWNAQLCFCLQAEISLVFAYTKSHSMFLLFAANAAANLILLISASLNFKQGGHTRFNLKLTKYDSLHKGKQFCSSPFQPRKSFLILCPCLKRKLHVGCPL